jgi:hypothetical protein
MLVQRRTYMCIWRRVVDFSNKNAGTPKWILYLHAGKSDDTCNILRIKKEIVTAPFQSLGIYFLRPEENCHSWAIKELISVSGNWCRIFVWIENLYG